MIDYESKEIVSRKDFTDKKIWLEQYIKKSERSNKEERRKQAKVTITQECPDCRHPEMYFYTMQLRSADEGTTVFYECVKCQSLYFSLMMLIHNFLAINQLKIIEELE